MDLPDGSQQLSWGVSFQYKSIGTGRQGRLFGACILTHDNDRGPVVGGLGFGQRFGTGLAGKVVIEDHQIGVGGLDQGQQAFRFTRRADDGHPWFFAKVQLQGQS